MASWTPVPLAGFGEDDEDAKTVLMSRARMAWEDEAHDADLTTPAGVGRTREDPQLVSFAADDSIDQGPPAPPAPPAERLLTPWQMALGVGMALPVAVAAAAWLLL